MSDLPDTVFIADTGTSKVQKLAQSQYPGGTIDWVAETANYVAWTDMDRELSDTDARSVWSLQVMNMQTHTVWTAASSGGKAMIGAPLFRMSGNTLVWLATHESGPDSDIMAADLRSHAIHTVLRNVQTSILDIDRSTVVYDNPDPASAVAADQGDPQAPRDIFAIPVSGGSPIQLSTQHDVTFPSAGGGWVAWGEPMNGDATQIWATALDGNTTGREVFKGGNVQRKIGTNFIALWTSGTTSLIVVPLSSSGLPGAPVALPGTPYIPAHFATDGALLAAAVDTDPNNATDIVTIIVNKVTVR